MSGETAKQESGWTVDTLKEYFEALRTDDQKAVEAALQAAKEAVLKAENASEKRFESVNEFRQQLADQTNTFLPRPEYDANHKALEKSLQDLTDRLNISTGKSSGTSATVAYIVTGIGLVFGAVGMILAFNN